MHVLETVARLRFISAEDAAQVLPAVQRSARPYGYAASNIVERNGLTWLHLEKDASRIKMFRVDHVLGVGVETEAEKIDEKPYDLSVINTVLPCDLRAEKVAFCQYHAAAGLGHGFVHAYVHRSFFDNETLTLVVGNILRFYLKTLSLDEKAKQRRLDLIREAKTTRDLLTLPDITSFQSWRGYEVFELETGSSSVLLVCDGNVLYGAVTVKPGQQYVPEITSTAESVLTEGLFGLLKPKKTTFWYNVFYDK